jgi:hypothetical protein
MEVLLNTGEIEKASAQLKSRAADMESAIQAAQTAISPLRSFKSPRVERDLAAWDELKSVFLKNLQNLLEAADELTRGVKANEAANN